MPVLSAMSLVPKPAQQFQVTDLASLAGVAGAPTLLLVPGCGCSQAMWADVLPQLPATRQVQATGHGRHVSHPAEVARVIERHLAPG
jgi:hypothetical protein